MTVRIVGIGEPMAGDDGVGTRVIERLRALPVPHGIELHSLRDPSELTTLVGGAERVLVVDAVLQPEAAGSVRLLDGSALAHARRSLSSHGVDALTAVEIARTLAGNDSFPEVSFLAVGIQRPGTLATELSPSASASVEEAVQLALAWVGGASHA